MTIDIAFSLLVTVPRDFIPKRFLYPPEAVLFASVVWFYRNEKKIVTETFLDLFGHTPPLNHAIGPVKTLFCRCPP